MKYLCLIYGDEDRYGEISEKAREKIVADCLAYTDRLRDIGHLVACERLEPVRAAKTLRKRNGRVSATDGPFAETKEQLGGFFLIEAADLEEAMHIASENPLADIAAIEVRPVMADGGIRE